MKTALWISVGITVVALVENALAPWAPFHVVHALLAIVLPFVLGGVAFGPGRAIRLRAWVLAIISALALQALAGLLIGFVYPWLLGAVGTDAAALAEPFYSLDAALAAVFEKAALRFGSSVERMGTIYLAFIMLWAGFGEEVFYRGYLHGTLARHRGFAFAAIVSALFFAVRHATQLALLWPAYPWAAAGVWLVVSFLVGLYMSVLYQKTRSLYLPITVHYVFNVIPFTAAVLAPATP
jgi:membrane protease YdiL (CAAX protease family)